MKLYCQSNAVYLNVQKLLICCCYKVNFPQHFKTYKRGYNLLQTFKTVKIREV